MMIRQNKKLDSILSTVGRTPLVALHKLYPNSGINLYGKIEGLNPGGSIKDRTATFILKKAFELGKIKRGDTIIESSSGNMAIGLAQACLYYGLQLIVVVDPNVNKQNVRILEAYGAKVDKVKEPALVGGYLSARINRVKTLLKDIPNSFWTNQYGNPNNPKAHRQTIAEIIEDVEHIGGEVDYIFVATSTCGTIMGCAQYCHERNMKTKVIGVDAVGSVIFGTPAKKRLIPGHGAGRPSQHLNPELITDAIHVDDRECVIGCHRLLRREAIFCGGSSGAIVSAVEKYLPNIPKGSNCVLVLCDRGERYMDTIYNEAWVRENIYQDWSIHKRA